jgi:hypothetical protein
MIEVVAGALLPPAILLLALLLLARRARRQRHLMELFYEKYPNAPRRRKRAWPFRLIAR